MRLLWHTYFRLQLTGTTASDRTEIKDLELPVVDREQTIASMSGRILILFADVILAVRVVTLQHRM